MEKISKEDKSIVIGGGIAGLLASRVLSEHFANVVLIEKDHYPEVHATVHHNLTTSMCC
jgi:flavin-dependent dehydrogenase